MLVCIAVLSMSEERDSHHDIVLATKTYIAKTLHAQVDMRPWPGTGALPRYLSNAYLMLHGELGGEPTLWLFAREQSTPAVVERHLVVLGEHWPGAMIVVFDQLPSYARQRLIEKGISFVVPGAQLYAPGHGIDFRSRARRPTPMREVLRPSSQATLLYLLLHSDAVGCARSATELAPILGQSLMTASRSLAELEAHGLAKRQKTGRTKEVCLAHDPREVWRLAQDRLRTPVLRRVTLLSGMPIDAQCWYVAGLSALSRRTMLAEPIAQTYAVSREAVRELEAAGGTVVPDASVLAGEADAVTMEVWSYDPAPLSQDGVVDPLSLFLSLRDDPDERVQGALRRMLEGLPW